MKIPTADSPVSATSRRHEVLQRLQRADCPLTSAEIADDLGVHKNTVRFHLDSLAEAGLVERTTRASVRPGRPAQAFTAIASMDPTGPRHFRDLAAVLTEALSSHPDGAALAVEAGRKWGHSIGAGANDPVESVNEAVESLVRLLQEFGFAPERDSSGTDDGAARPNVDTSPGVVGSGPSQGARRSLPVVSVRRCPFLELAEEYQHIVCPVHLGLMRGALEAWGSDAHVDALEPFVEPDRCLVRLSTTA